MTDREVNPTTPLSRAIASLVRLASWNARDADLLSAGRHPGNASVLIHWAVERLVEAVVASEVGWPNTVKAPSIGQIPNENPLKLVLARVAKLAQPPDTFDVQADGSLGQTFDRELFRQNLAAVRELIQDLASRFGVDLSGDESAKYAEPLRPPAIPAAKPRDAKQANPAPARALPTTEDHSSPTVVKPRIAKGPSRPIALQDTRSKKQEEAKTGKVEGRSPIEVAPGGAKLTSSAFWALVDRWQIPDLGALQLIGHGGGLSKKGTRPRFKLLGEEVEMVKLLLEIDSALSTLGLDPRSWLTKPVKDAPFRGTTLLSYLTANGIKGVRETSRYILKNGLRLSMSKVE
jgi:hypothetical protein